MPLKALKEVATGRNGLGGFILQCKRLEFHYCDWAGSSRGMNNFLRSPTHLETLSKRFPGVEISISPRPNKHPVIRGTYINGKERSICVRNLEKDQVMQKVMLLVEATGERNRMIRGKNVVSTNESVRGVWSPYHADQPQSI